MSHSVRAERDPNNVSWWVCEHCQDRWRRPPTDVCGPLLTQLEAEEFAGWGTVTPSLPRLERILQLVASVMEAAA